jgi:hypothetical protein
MKRFEYQPSEGLVHPQKTTDQSLSLPNIKMCFLNLNLFIYVSFQNSHIRHMRHITKNRESIKRYFGIKRHTFLGVTIFDSVDGLRLESFAINFYNPRRQSKCKNPITIVPNKP